ncbi:MAG: hydrogenase nickel incorporation protein HypB [Candidatus Aminicenantes bacterium]|nr:hydrogenase nickel incorporation protein HypB [Candidatus Aminicenantes bacterium]
MKNKEVLVREALLGSNARVAADVRQALRRKKILGVNLMSSPGSGKTTLLEQIAERLGGGYRLAVIEGDIETERDAARIRAKGIPAWQITTGGACHLEAKMIGRIFPEIPPDLDFLFIENVGNLVCPAAYDLGESLRCVLLSVPEGDDKPKKYPKAFLTADCLVITKSDLLPILAYDLEGVKQEALDINPRLSVFVLSALTGDGLEPFLQYLVRFREKAISPDA